MSLSLSDEEIGELDPGDQVLVRVRPNDFHLFGYRVYGPEGALLGIGAFEAHCWEVLGYTPTVAVMVAGAGSLEHDRYVMIKELWIVEGLVLGGIKNYRAWQRICEDRTSTIEESLDGVADAHVEVTFEVHKNQIVCELPDPVRDS